MIKKQDKVFLQFAIDEASKNIDNGGGPFAAVIVSPKGEVVCVKGNTVTRTFDPTAHAEINAIRLACKLHRTFSLKGYTIYSSCEPCPMCLGAIYWAGISRIVYGASAEDAAEIDFSDKFIYDELALPKTKRSVLMERGLKKEALVPFEKWKETQGKVMY